MSGTNYKYAPSLPEEFRCRVPLPGTVQALVNNGILRDKVEFDAGIKIVPGKDIGFVYNVPANCIAKESLQVISFRDSSNTSDISYQNSLVFGKDSESSMLLCTHTLSMDQFNTDEIVNIDIEEGATADIVVMQNEHNSSRHKVTFRVKVSRKGNVRINVVTLHGAQLDNSFEVDLKGKEAKCELNGVYLVDGTQKINTEVRMNHLVPDCWSSQLFKGILDDKSVASFTGRILVAKDAQKTEAYQANHNLLVSSSAKAYAKPQLEIYADDVKCSHGATSGRLDENALFYMRSRGIGASEAKLLQQLAFAYDVLEKIDNDKLRQRLYDLVESRLRGEFSHCDNCSMNCC